MDGLPKKILLATFILGVVGASQDISNIPCQSLYDSSTVTFSCNKDGTAVSCENATDNTTMTYQCAPYYELSIHQEQELPTTSTCRLGSWGFTPECVPVCGEKRVSATPLVVGGYEMERGRYPWVVALYSSKDSDPFFTNICSGSLISPEIVITAAHCVTKKETGKPYSERYYKVGAGKYYSGYQDSRDKDTAQYAEKIEYTLTSQIMGSIRRGAFIVIEGVDRSGKSTQCKKLVELLQEKNIKSELMNFPDRSTLTGKLINEYLKNKDCTLNDHAIHLLFAANRWENVDKLKMLLHQGVTLIMDRYSYSGIAFSSAKNGMDLNWCKYPENGLPKPDLVFLLTLNHEEASKRSGFGEERYENESMQNNVANVFSQLAKEGDNWKIVDASGSISAVQSTLLEAVIQKIKEVEMKSLQTLDFTHTDS